MLKKKKKTLEYSYVSRITAVVANKVGLRVTHSMQVVANKGEVEVRVCPFFFCFLFLLCQLFGLAFTS